ncbi:hypothetical protein DYB32_001420 [Aphanomyces invadans]|uniref:Uncharacterized protein n=1 Tax=Aphanomyces invadans TaxID=157072 RepID=A0A418B6M5_9STRA|nr:hypothetical protein DYB32_001420 [Aphanomyces invadans]
MRNCVKSLLRVVEGNKLRKKRQVKAKKTASLKKVFRPLKDGIVLIKSNKTLLTHLSGSSEFRSIYKKYLLRIF